MPIDLEDEIGKDLEESDKTIKILLLLSPKHRFITILFVALCFLLLIAYFMHINQDNPEIQKGILGLLVGGAGGGAGGYIGARTKAK